METDLQRMKSTRWCMVRIEDLSTLSKIVFL